MMGSSDSAEEKTMGGDDAASSATAAMFTYPTSPLFEQPFANRDFYAEQTPLRSRGGGASSTASSGENDAFSSSFVTTNPYFSSPERRRKSSFSHYYHQHYSSPHAAERWVKHVMRLVLLSPVIVLILWSVGAVLFSSSAASTRQAALQKPLAPRTPRGVVLRNMRHPPQPPVRRQQLQQQGEQQDKGFVQEGLAELVELSGDLLGEAQPPLGQAQVSQPLGLAAQQAPLGQVQGQQPLGQQPLGLAQVQQPLGQSVLQQELLPMGATQLQQQEPLGRKQQPQRHRDNRFIPVINPLGSSSSAQENPGQSRAARMVQSVQQYLRPEPPKGFSKNSKPDNLIVQPKLGSLRGSQRTVYYYYDPRSTAQGPDGRVLAVPPVVYDNEGHVLSTNNLLAAGAQVVLQQPLYGSTSGSSISSNSNETADASAIAVREEEPIKQSSLAQPPETTMLLQQQAADPRKTISMSDIQANVLQGVERAEVRYQQQQGGSSIIVMTVAVMALLVGALSARRLRGRASVLSACIENERLDHDAALYDSTTADNGNATNNTAYSTFHWKGDLEKFDV